MQRVTCLWCIACMLVLAKPVLSFGESQLVWDPSTGTVEGYRIYYGISEGTYSEKRDVGEVNTYPLFDLPLKEGNTYHIVVKAYNHSGESRPSHEVTWEVPDTSPPAPPGDVTCSADQGGGALLSWAENGEEDLKEYRVYHGTESRIYGPATPVRTGTTLTLGTLDRTVSHYFAVTAVDLSANESGWSQEVFLQASDSAPPVVAIEKPVADGTFTSNNSVLTVSGSAADDTAVASVSWSSSKGAGGLASGRESWSIPEIVLQEGENLITVTATDTAGNMGYQTLMVTFLSEDRVSPEIRITAPTGRSPLWTREFSIRFEGSATDNVAVDEVQWSNRSRYGRSAGTATGTASWFADDIALARGWNRISFMAFDTSGNRKDTSLWVYKSR